MRGAKGFGLSVGCAALVFCSGVLAKDQRGDASFKNGRGTPPVSTAAQRSPPTSPVIQHGMRLRCRFVSSASLITKDGEIIGKVYNKPDEETFRVEVIDGHLILAGNAGVDRLYAIHNDPGDSAYFFGQTDLGNIILWSFHWFDRGSILAVKQNSYRDLIGIETSSWTSVANCTVTGGNGIAVTR